LDWGESGQHELILVKPSEAQDTKKTLHIPHDARAVIVTIQSPFGQKGYTYELFATYDNLPDAKDSQHARIVAVPGRSRHVPPISIVIWRRRVYCQGIAAFIEACGDPRTEITPINLIQVDYIPARDVLRALRGRHLLRKIEHKGRRRGSKNMSEVEFRQRYPEMYQQLLDDYGSKPRRYEVAEALDMDQKTFRNHLKDCNLSFPPS
jgi:hypothetical protein